ncbi:unnamed protein product [Arabidopsis halleri]
MPPVISSPSISNPSNMEKAIALISCLPLTNASDAHNELLLTSSGSVSHISSLTIISLLLYIISNPSNPGQDASSNPSESALDLPVNSSPSRLTITDPDKCVGSPSALLVPNPTEVHIHLPSEYVIPPMYS